MKFAPAQADLDVCALRNAAQPRRFDDRSQGSTAGFKRHDRSGAQQLNNLDNRAEAFGAANAQQHIFRAYAESRFPVMRRNPPANVKVPFSVTPLMRFIRGLPTKLATKVSTGYS
jgi:hypothetical protein